jgi:hypothetical protein
MLVFISNLMVPFITYLLLLKDFLKNEDKDFSGFFRIFLMDF